MRANLTNRITRRRLGMTAAGIAAVGALVVPGVAWAADAIPLGDAVPQATLESTPATMTTPAQGDVVAGEALQKLIDEGLSEQATTEQQEALVQAVKSMVPEGSADSVSIESIRKTVAAGAQAAVVGDQTALVEAQPALPAR